MISYRVTFRNRNGHESTSEIPGRDQADAMSFAEQVAKSQGATVISVEPVATEAPKTWHDDPATSKQRAYLSKLGVKVDDSLTKGRASELIDAAKNSDLGSVYGWRWDGSN